MLGSFDNLVSDEKHVEKCIKYCEKHVDFFAFILKKSHPPTRYILPNKHCFTNVHICTYISFKNLVLCEIQTKIFCS
jgi:hypothetical protein